VLCTTQGDLQRAVEAGRFREDLYFRLVVYPIVVPPLRDRKEDLPLLVTHCIQKLQSDVGREVRRVDPEVLESLSQYHWPGNVRELENVVHRSLLACRGDAIAVGDLPPDIRRLGLPTLPPMADDRAAEMFGEEKEVLPLRELERRAIQRALKVTNGSVSRAAKLLGIGRATLYRRIASFELTQDVA
jgi:DNA-binding NtrC family response regulator